MTDKEIKEKIARKSRWFTVEECVGKNICNHCCSVFKRIDNILMCPTCHDSYDDEYTYYDSHDFVSQEELKEFVDKGFISKYELFDLEIDENDYFHVTDPSLKYYSDP